MAKRPLSISVTRKEGEREQFSAGLRLSRGGPGEYHTGIIMMMLQ